ncbi:MAG: CoA-binding protein [Desulfobaccales bacterium]
MEKNLTHIKAVPEHIDVVAIFRNIEAIPGIVKEPISVGAGCIWASPRIVNRTGSEAQAQPLPVAAARAG